MSYWSDRLKRDPEYREQKNAYSRRYYAEKKHTIRARRAAWREAEPAQFKVWSIRSDAKDRGLAFALPTALALDLVTDFCFYCGAAPSPVNGIDRVDNTRGYEEDNVVSCCTQCNTAKLDQSLADFTAWITRVSAHVARHGIA